MHKVKTIAIATVAMRNIGHGPALTPSSFDENIAPRLNPPKNQSMPIANNISFIKATVSFSRLVILRRSVYFQRS